MTCDALGNISNGPLHSYSYEAESRLISVASGAATYKYDAQGNRVQVMAEVVKVLVTALPISDSSLFPAITAPEKEARVGRWPGGTVRSPLHFRRNLLQPTN